MPKQPQPADDRPVDPIVEAHGHGRFTPVEKSSKSKRRRRSRPQQPHAPSDYLTRHELLALVPLCMSSIDDLERRGIFPSRFKLEPTTRVAWKRREVVRFMEQRARRRVHEPAAKGEAPATTTPDTAA
jgi:predicted DNA-binding transcriptional regulator AlpA